MVRAIWDSICASQGLEQRIKQCKTRFRRIDEKNWEPVASSSAPDAAAAVRNFLDSLRGQSGLAGGQQQQGADKPYPYLNHLLPTSITVPMIDSAPEEFTDALISYLPPAVVVLASGSSDSVDGKSDPSAAAVEAAKASLSLGDKRTLLKKVVRSPQFNQALASLTMAIRDGGLPSIADALGVKVQDGGYLRGSGMPLGGGQAVEAFVEGVKKTVEEEQNSDSAPLDTQRIVIMDLSFPTDPREFDSDDRISFSKLDNKFIAVHDDGNEYEFDAELKRWVLTDDEPLEPEPFDDAHQGFGDPSAYGAEDGGSRKRKNGSSHDSETPEASRPARPKKQKAPPQPKQNTAVYVTGLPADTTVEEVHELFSRKGGVIAEEIDSGAPRIKLYNDSEGNFKGDALIVFFKPQSVEMAIMLLDDTDFRITASGTREGRIRVQAADSSYKKVKYDQDGGGAADKGNGGAERKPHQKNDRDRQKIIKKTQKLDAKLADWDDDIPYAGQAESTSKWDKLVILRHMFTLEELEEDPAALLEIKEDIREECAKLGTVTNVVLFDQEPEGIVSVKFKEAESALACIKLMHGRSFDGRTVEAFLATGKEKFKKSKEEQNDAEDSD
ncbi:hypothetical protein NM208_g14686 [Fusarium decemcellulare]|uniref:Uncharacterized protein n=1 Tax=Fusarium decemcellulare TaxID=57161 RepID=A0ACC1RHQ9_9HYPO|nr:hypothetical protein NM208_g14686 [Fusarium decemcellulare]